MDAQLDTSTYVYDWIRRYISHDLMMKNVICQPVLILVFYLVTTYQDNLLVQVGKIDMFFLENLRMELKCHCYDIMNIYVLNIFYYTKTTSDTDIDFPL